MKLNSNEEYFFGHLVNLLIENLNSIEDLYVYPELYVVEEDFLDLLDRKDITILLSSLTKKKLINRIGTDDKWEITNKGIDVALELFE